MHIFKKKEKKNAGQLLNDAHKQANEITQIILGYDISGNPDLANALNNLHMDMVALKQKILNIDGSEYIKENYDALEGKKLLLQDIPDDIKVMYR